MEKPFVKLFRTINACYMFEVGKNEIIQIDNDVYDAVKKILSSKKDKIVEFPCNVMEKINQLKNRKYLSSNKIEEVKHPETDNLKYLLDRKLLKLTLQITQQCNLRCSYCIYNDSNNIKQRSHSSQRMTFQTARKAIDFFMKHSIDNEKVNIGFYGGEPLLNISLIKKVIEYIKIKYIGKEVTYSLTTNATLLNDHIIQYFIENSINLLISLDGPKHINDINRRFAADGTGSYETIYNNLLYIKNKYPKYFKTIGISMVMDPQNSYKEINLIFNDDLYNNLMITAGINDDMYSIEKNVFSEYFIEQRSYDIFVALLGHFECVDSIKASPISDKSVARFIQDIEARKILSEMPHSGAPGGPCIPGQKRLFVDINGTFYPCERVSESSDVMKIGNIDEGFHYNKCHDLLNIGALTPERCKNCWAFLSCNMCAKHVDDGDTLSGSRKLTGCTQAINNFKEQIEFEILFKEIKEYYM